MKISPVSTVAVCTTVRFAASGWIFCPRFATSEQERRCTRAQRAPEGRGPGRPEFHAPADVAPTTSLVASTNLGQNAGDPWVAPTISTPQTGAISGLGAPHAASASNDSDRVGCGPRVRGPYSRASGPLSPTRTVCGRALSHGSEPGHAINDFRSPAIEKPRRGTRCPCHPLGISSRSR